MVVAEKQQRVLHFRESEVRSDLRWIEILDDVTGMKILVLRLHENGILRCQLQLDLAVELEAVQIGVRVKTSNVKILRVERVAEGPEGGELGGRLAQIAVAGILRDAVEPEVAFSEQA